MIAFLLGFVSLFVCLIVSSSFHLVRFGQLLRHADKRIVTTMKVYIERNNLQVELTLWRQDVLAWLEPEGQRKNTDPDTDPMGPICKQKME